MASMWIPAIYLCTTVADANLCYRLFLTNWNSMIQNFAIQPAFGFLLFDEDCVKTDLIDYSKYICLLIEPYKQAILDFITLD